jgi:hypothetical protein
VVIDPTQEQVLAAVPVGSEPGVMALSDDGSTLWVGIDGAFAIRRVDLRTDPPTPGAMHSLPTSTPFNDAVAVTSMVVLPGSVLAATSGQYGRNLLLLDEGVPRGPSPMFFQSVGSVSLGPPGYLFASGGGFLVVKVSATGITTAPFQLLSSDIITYIPGRVFGSSGVVVDVSSPDSPVRAGTFGYGGMVVGSARPERVVMVSGPTFDQMDVTLRVLDVERFVQTASVVVKDLRLGGYPETRLWGMAQVGPETVAFLGGSAFFPSSPDANPPRLFLLDAALLRSLP